MNTVSHQIAAILLLLTLYPNSLWADDKPRPLVKTVTATQAINLSDVVADFVIELVRKNIGGVQDQYRKLTASTEEFAGRHYSTRRFEGIEWIVADDRAQMMGADFVHAVDAIYLARQQLVMDSHAAVHVLTNVVAKVHVEAEHSGKGEGPKTKHGWVYKGAVIKLTFQGFLDSVPLTMK